MLVQPHRLGVLMGRGLGYRRLMDLQEEMVYGVEAPLQVQSPALMEAQVMG